MRIVLRQTRYLFTQVSNKMNRAEQEISLKRAYPLPPQLIPGQLDQFRFTGENQRLFDGYTLDELYGSKIGLKHSPAMQAERMKDNIVCLILLVAGFTILGRLLKMEKKSIISLNRMVKARKSRVVDLPEDAKEVLKRHTSKKTRKRFIYHAKERYL